MHWFQYCWKTDDHKDMDGKFYAINLEDAKEEVLKKYRRAKDITKFK
jgi:hypothetical protein